MSALGGLVWYLRSLKLDEELMSFKNFHVYDPVRQASTLILDGQTLSNLEVFQNNSDGTETGTVLRLLNRCVTPFGKQLTFVKCMQTYCSELTCRSTHLLFI